jgi:flavodoxin/ferredoxin
MKSIIIYYSLTGNTKSIAKAVCKGIVESTGQCDLVKMKDLDARSLSDYSLIGFGSPVWGGVPPNVKLFIARLTSLDGKHAFAFSTHASLGQRFFEIIGLLRKKNLTVIGIRDWYASAYLPNLPKPYLTDGHPDEIDLKEAFDFGKEMARVSNKVFTRGAMVIPPLPNVPEMPPRNPLAYPLPGFDRRKCTYPKCHLCMDNCPMDGINLSLSPPVFAKPCRTCYFCEMVCPTGAIEVDYEPLAKAVLGRVKRVFVPHLAQAEAEGRFRRLLPLDKVGWKTPYYKVFEKHPRYVIPPE